MRHSGFALHNVLGAGLNRPLSPVEVELNVRALSAGTFRDPEPYELRLSKHEPATCPRCGGTEWVVEETWSGEDCDEEVREACCENCGWPL